MVIIDGGKGQLGVAKRVFNELSILDRVDLVSISKNSSHKSDILHFIDGNTVKFENSKFFNLLATIQDEVHRFVITFHRKKRSKSMTSQLPVLNFRNQAIPNPDAMAVNTAMQRCLAKAIALHGIGLYIYSGEDIPESEQPAPKAVSSKDFL